MCRWCRTDRLKTHGTRGRTRLRPRAGERALELEKPRPSLSSFAGNRKLAACGESSPYAFYLRGRARVYDQVQLFAW